MDVRKDDRTRLIYKLRVTYADSGAVLGHVVDIGRRGMMLISQNLIDTGQTISLKIIPPQNVTNSEPLNVRGEIRWCRNRPPEDYYIGIRFEEIDEITGGRVAGLVEQFYQMELDDVVTRDPYRLENDLSDIL